MNRSEQINELATALAKAQGEIKGAKKDSGNPFFNSRYADLASVWDACREPLSKNGLAILQTTRSGEKGLELVTTLVHSSGQSVSSILPVILQKQDPQSIGSALTYFRRYALSAIVGVAPEDDDGEAAMGRDQPQAKPHAIRNVTSAVAKPTAASPRAGRGEPVSG